MNGFRFLIYLLLAFPSFLFSQWQLMHPYPQGSQVNGIHFSDPQNGWFVVSNGTIWHSTDGGSSWSNQQKAASFGLNSVNFINSQLGWAGGNYSTFLKTTNGGSTWSSGPPLPYFESITKLQFLQPTKGWAAASRGAVYRSIPSEAFWMKSFQWPLEWDDDILVPPGPIAGLSVLDSLNVWAIGKRMFRPSAVLENIIIKTTNGGISWDTVRINFGGEVTDINFVSPQRGWYLGDSATIVGTTDGGITWTREFSGASFSSTPLRTLASAGTSHAWAVGHAGLVVRTTNGGAVWQAVQIDTLAHLSSVYFIDATTGWCAGEGGEIFKTANGGGSWLKQSKGLPYFFYAVDFVSPNTGWASSISGWGAPNGIFRTDDSGHSWQMQYTELGTSFTDIDMIDSAIGYAFSYGTATRLLKTIDGGASWAQTSLTLVDGAQGLEFVDANSGWVYGDRESNSYRQVVHRTTNGGITWTAAAIDTPYFLSSITDLFYLDALRVWCVNQQGVYKSTDGGVTWDRIFADVGYPIALSLCFVDELRGWLAGNGGIVRHTTDGGRTWTQQVSNTRNQIEKIRFVDAQRGWAVGYEHLISTSDGGEQWVVDTLETNEALFDVSILKQTNKFTVWSVGQRGTVLRLQQQLTAVDLPEQPTRPATFALYQNYPNPFNPMTNIRFRIVDFGLVVLKVYDVLGKEIATLVNKELKPGSYETVFDGQGLASGVYFYRLVAGSFTDTKKLIVLR